MQTSRKWRHPDIMCLLTKGHKTGSDPSLKKHLDAAVRLWEVQQTQEQGSDCGEHYWSNVQFLQQINWKDKYRMEGNLQHWRNSQDVPNFKKKSKTLVPAEAHPGDKWITIQIKTGSFGGRYDSDRTGRVLLEQVAELFFFFFFNRVIGD